MHKRSMPRSISAAALAVLVTSQHSLAFPSDPADQQGETPAIVSRALSSGSKSPSDWMRKVALIGVENRQVLAKGQYPASGSMRCDETGSSAQLTGRPDIITTAAHHFVDDQCRPRNRSGCTFDMFTADGKFHRLPVLLSTLKLGACPLSNSHNDWAVLKLAAPVRGVEPYAIPISDGYPEAGQDVTNIASAQLNFVVNGVLPRTISICVIRDIDEHSDDPIRHDCNTGVGASGSGIFIQAGNKKIIVAIHVQSRTESKEGSGYDRNALYNVATPLSGDFLKTLHEMMRN